MCLAIAPPDRPRAGRLHRLRRFLAQTPFRLLSFGAALHSIVLVVLLHSGTLPPGPMTSLTLQFCIVFGLIAMLVFGFLMDQFPRWLHSSAMHYGWYGGTCVVGLIGLALLELGLYSGWGWVVAGAATLALAWLIAGRGLWWVSVWTTSTERRGARLVLRALALGGTGIAIFVAGLLAGEVSWMRASVLVGLALGWLPVLVGVAIVSRRSRRLLVSG